MLELAYATAAAILAFATAAALIPEVFGRRLAPAVALTGMALTLVVPQVALLGIAITAAMFLYAGLDDPVALAAFGVHLVCWTALAAYGVAVVKARPVLDGEPVEQGTAKTPYLPWLIFRTRAMRGVRVTRRIVFREVSGVRLRLDVYHPPALRGQAPAVLYIHGGGWITGTRRQSRFLLYELASAGWCVFSISYRLAPRYPLPAGIEDAQAGLQWLREHAAEHGADPSKIVLIGGSAGGHIAALLALTANPPVQGAVILYGATHITGAFEGDRRYPGLSAFFERVVFRRRYSDAPEVFRAADPFHHAGPHAPPILLIHGLKDLLVPVAQSRVFAAKLRAEGARQVHLLEVPQALHAFEVLPTPLHQRAVRIVLRFLEGVLGSY